MSGYSFAALLALAAVLWRMGYTTAAGAAGGIGSYLGYRKYS